MLFVVKYLVELIVAVFSGGTTILEEATINVYIAAQRAACSFRNHRFALFASAVYESDCVLTQFAIQSQTNKLFMLY